MFEKSIIVSLDYSIVSVIDWHYRGWPKSWSTDAGICDTSFNLTNIFLVHMICVVTGSYYTLYLQASETTSLERSGIVCSKLIYPYQVISDWDSIIGWLKTKAPMPIPDWGLFVKEYMKKTEPTPFYTAPVATILGIPNSLYLFQINSKESP